MKCFIDMDGVLTDFAAGFNRKYGLSLPDPLFNEDDLPAALCKTTQEIDADLGRDFWAGLPWMPEGRSVLQLLEAKFGFENCYLLTFPSYNAEGATGKIDWVRANLPDYSMRLILATVKHVCAAPDTILLDDKQRNVIEFERAGGHGLLVPSPWNAASGQYHRIIDYLRTRIAEYAGHFAEYAGIAG